MILALPIGIVWIWMHMDNRLVDNNALILGHALPRLTECIDNARNLRQSQNPYETTDVCYHQLHSQGLLNDFQIRRAQFSIQYYSGKVILWMVVILTLSGVILSGMQLIIAYKLARSGQISAIETKQQFSIEEGKIVFKSSIAGLFILLFSFAFFYVYILKVYTIYEIQPDGGVPVSAIPEYDGNTNSQLPPIEDHGGIGHIDAQPTAVPVGPAE